MSDGPYRQELAAWERSRAATKQIADRALMRTVLDDLGQMLSEFDRAIATAEKTRRTLAAALSKLEAEVPA